MSIHLPPPNNISVPYSDPVESSASESENDEEETWDDWVSDSNTRQGCKSLFDETILSCVDDAVKYDRENYKIDINELCKRLSLDFHGRVRLINFIRRNKPKPVDVVDFRGTEPWFSSDQYLVPVLENDLLIQAPSDDWSESEDGEVENADPSHKIKILEKKLAFARQSLVDYRTLITEKYNVSKLVEDANEPISHQVAASGRDDDTHYFRSYGEHDIHAVMIQDKVRTSTYAHFILTNPFLFRDAVVLDVGCGTGILSLFAARAGAKRVFAVDASDIADRAEKIVRANGLANIITVIRGKVEEISLPEGIKQVDIIISEWMGYALLYESMLDSVLRARDRFLRPGGVMAPSQCRMMLGLCDGSEIYKDRIGFWEDVYGFDLSIMANDLYDEAIIDVVGPEVLLSEGYLIKDLILSDITTRQLDFSSSFRLVSTAQRRTKVNAFILYFDAFFTASGLPVSPHTEVKAIKEGEPVLAELWPVGGKPAHQRRQSMGREKDEITSFSTGPASTPTHWKQTIFILREPMIVSGGSVVQGSFRCRKSDNNSRELDVEIHYSVVESEGATPTDTIVQMYKVR